MKFTFLGTGSAFCMNNYQTNILVEDGKHKLLIDAGGDVRFALAELGYTYKDLDAIYITHGHADHIGGIEYVSFCSYFDPSKNKIPLYCNKGLVDDLWNNALSFGLSSVQGKVVNLNDYFNLEQIDSNGYFNWGSGKFEIVQAVHIMNGYTIVPTFGLMITIGKKKIYFTGDTQFNPHQIEDFYEEADIIIQDCETTKFCSRVHANYSELRTLKYETKRKMWLVHYQDLILSSKYNDKKKLKSAANILGIDVEKLKYRLSMETIISEKWEKKAKEDAFKGFVEKGQTIEI